MLNGPRRWAAFAILSLAGSGCAVSNLQFVTDNRLHFVAPHSRALVQLPVTLRWAMSDFTVVPPGTVPVSRRQGYFGVFVDRSPVRPGQTVAVVADSSCRRTPGCLNAGYLADRGVYTASTDEVTLSQIASLNSYQKVQTHEATVVILDSAGRRIGESAWYLDFRLKAPRQ